jgi:hypothetical protein
MFVYTVFVKKLSISTAKIDAITENVETYTDERSALIEAIIRNFEYIEENDFFYDPEDEYLNNYYFEETPQGTLNRFNLDWETPQQLRSFDKLYRLENRDLYNILRIQRYIVTPKCKRNLPSYSHEYTSVKKEFYNPISKLS